MQRRILILLVGCFGLVAVGTSLKLAAVAHAQDTPASVSACKSIVPKAWGAYRGSSPFGLTFEDEKGTLRFIDRPSCGAISQSDGTAASTPPSMEIERH